MLELDYLNEVGFKLFEWCWRLWKWS